MRFISYQIDGQHSFGALIENRVFDLARRMSNHSTLDDVVRAGAMVRAKDIAAESSADYELKDIVITAPTSQAGKVICVQWRTGNPPQQPISDENVYLRPAESLTGPDTELVLPEGYQALAGRPALALVVGSGGRRIAEKRIRDALAGVTLANSGAVRTWPASADSAARGTTFPTSGAIGPWLVTLDDVDDLNNLNLTLQINEQPQALLSALDSSVGLAAQISQLSEIIQLNPGDLIVLERFSADQESADQGSADQQSGAEVTMSPGDRLTLHCDPLGTLSNELIADADQAAQNSSG